MHAGSFVGTHGELHAASMQAMHSGSGGNNVGMHTLLTASWRASTTFLVAPLMRRPMTSNFVLAFFNSNGLGFLGAAALMAFTGAERFLAMFAAARLTVQL